MKVVIAGSRWLNNFDLVVEAVKASGFTISEVVSGRARGVDTLGERWAKENNVPIKEFPADDDFKLSSDLGGFARNGEMAAYADALILIWDGVSGGSRNMLQHAERHAKKRPFAIYVHRVS
jgi:hypothetical protein